VRTVTAGVTVIRDDNTIVEYRFATQCNRARFESLLRFDDLDDEDVAAILAKYDAYHASQR
jgi:hypothetical protein